MVATIASTALLLATGCTQNQLIKQETKAMSNETAITLINPFQVPEDKIEATIAMWEQARNFLQTQPGYISTALHQSVAPDARYRLINIAKWESVDSFKAATAKMQAEANLPRVEGAAGNPGLYTIIRRD